MSKEDDEMLRLRCGDEAAYCLTLLEHIGKAVDQYSDHWEPEEFAVLSRTRDYLNHVLAVLKANGMYPPPPYRRS